jgi:DNA-binding beta-propeller fold protein YncE
MRTGVFVDPRRAGSFVVAVAVLMTACVALAAPAARATKGVVSAFGAPGSGDGQFAMAGSTAVNITSGDVYVVDQGNNRVEQVDAADGFVRTWGWGVADGNASFEVCSSGCQAGQAGPGDGQFDFPQGIAIDQSDGSVYVVDGNNNRVEKFNSSGAFLSQLGTAGSAEGQLSGPQGIAVSPVDGSVYVADANNNRVAKFDSSGAFVHVFGYGVADGSDAFQACSSSCQPGLGGAEDGEFAGPTRVAIDSAGRVYVLDFGNGRIERFTSTDAFDEQFDPTDVNGGTFAFEIALGSNDHAYVAQAAPDFSEQRVFEIDSAGSLVDIHGAGSTAGNASGLALSSGSQKIYLADGFNARVFVMDDVTPPIASMDPATNVTSTSASISGTVNPQGPPDVSWRFEVSTDEASWSPVAADQNAGSGTSGVPVNASLSDLVPNTTYFVRVVATRPFNLPVTSSDVQFTTTAVGPDGNTLSANDVGTTHASFMGTLNAHHSPTTYFFEYGTSTAYGHRFPAADADGGSSNSSIGVVQRIDGLQPGTNYHYRIVVTNPVNTVHGTDQTFTTTTTPGPSSPRPGIPGTGSLPDDRGWEEASPPDKNGVDVRGDVSRTRVALTETPAMPMAATFSSLGAFGDARGTGISNEYMSIRTGQPNSNGWTTHAITPPQAPSTFFGAPRGFDPVWEGELSPDLTHGIFRAWSPLDNTPAVANTENLYARSDLRTPGVGTYQLVTSCPICGTTPLAPPQESTWLPHLAAASADFNHIIFESTYPLILGSTANSSSQNSNLYEWVNGSLRTAGILPDGSIAQRSIAGQGADIHPTIHTISEDGSRVIFTDSSVTHDNTGVLYMRLNGSTTVQINASEKTPADTPQPATFWAATPDASHVFFTTAEQLTSDDTNGNVDAYMYDANAPVGQHLTRLSVSSDSADSPGEVNGVIGVSDDGHFAYFINGSGSLLSQQPRFVGAKIYEWHDGTVSYVGTLTVSQDVLVDLPRSWSDSNPMAARVSPDGRHLLFVSHSGAGLTGYDQGSCSGFGCPEIYVYSAGSHALQCASCNPTGATATAAASVTTHFGGGAAGVSSHLNHPLSDDGRHVFFDTAEALVPDDVNGASDAYEFDTQSGTVHLLSTGKDPSGSYFMDASGDGSNAFFISRQELVGWDHDQNYDLYDARVGGGFPDPPLPTPGCSEESCQGPLGSAPDASAPPSSMVHGTGNVKSTGRTAKRKPKPVRCRRGLVRKRIKGKVRCVKRATSRSAHRHGQRAARTVTRHGRGR